MFEEPHTQASPFTFKETQNILLPYLGISAAAFLSIAVLFDIARRIYKMQKEKKKKMNMTGEFKMEGENSRNFMLLSTDACFHASVVFNLGFPIFAYFVACNYLIILMLFILVLFSIHIGLLLAAFF